MPFFKTTDQKPRHNGLFRICVCYSHKNGEMHKQISGKVGVRRKFLGNITICNLCNGFVNIVFVNYAKKQDGSKLDMVKNSEYNGYGCITIVEKRCYVASFAVAAIFKMITKGCKAARR